MYILESVDTVGRNLIQKIEDNSVAEVCLDLLYFIHCVSVFSS